jgi:hypothetical protein
MATSPKRLGPEKGYLARASSIYKRQTRRFVREGALQKQDRNCQRVINIWPWAPDGARRQDLLIDWPSVAMGLWLDFDSTDFGGKTSRFKNSVLIIALILDT